MDVLNLLLRSADLRRWDHSRSAPPPIKVIKISCCSPRLHVRADVAPDGSGRSDVHITPPVY